MATKDRIWIKSTLISRRLEHSGVLGALSIVPGYVLGSIGRFPIRAKIPPFLWGWTNMFALSATRGGGMMFSSLTSSFNIFYALSMIFVRWIQRKYMQQSIQPKLKWHSTCLHFRNQIFISKNQRIPYSLLSVEDFSTF